MEILERVLTVPSYEKAVRKRILMSIMKCRGHAIMSRVPCEPPWHAWQKKFWVCPSQRLTCSDHATRRTIFLYIYRWDQPFTGQITAVIATYICLLLLWLVFFLVISLSTTLTPSDIPCAFSHFKRQSCRWALFYLLWIMDLDMVPPLPALVMADFRQDFRIVTGPKYNVGPLPLTILTTLSLRLMPLTQRVLYVSLLAICCRFIWCLLSRLPC